MATDESAANASNDCCDLHHMPRCAALHSGFLTHVTLDAIEREKLRWYMQDPTGQKRAHRVCLLAHGLINTMTAVVGNCDLLRDTAKLDGESLERVLRIRELAMSAARTLAAQDCQGLIAYTYAQHGTNEYRDETEPAKPELIDHVVGH